MSQQGKAKQYCASAVYLDWCFWSLKTPSCSGFVAGTTQISGREGQQQEDIFNKKGCLLLWSLTLRAAQQQAELDLSG